jgi:hypothetical protein
MTCQRKARPCNFRAQVTSLKEIRSDMPQEPTRAKWLVKGYLIPVRFLSHAESFHSAAVSSSVSEQHGRAAHNRAADC